MDERSSKGGARAGAGRKPVIGKSPMVRVTVTIPRSHLATLKRWGGGNASEGVRCMVLDARSLDQAERRR